MNKQYKLGISRAWEYWRFLFPIASEDVSQTVWLTVLQAFESRKEFIKALNRNLYRLARDLGYRSLTNSNEHGYWWEHEGTSFQRILR